MKTFRLALFFASLSFFALQSQAAGGQSNLDAGILEFANQPTYCEQLEQLSASKGAGADGLDAALSSALGSLLEISNGDTPMVYAKLTVACSEYQTTLQDGRSGNAGTALGKAEAEFLRGLAAFRAR
jgi:hypothetical protein